ncbi:MAG: low molecular weight phosphotyrosine protein phosphatase [Desulfatitalea sp.]|nr:low molecular weight phosphotyrosine protein phosphatase [Desulfatitalea sp.]
MLMVCTGNICRSPMAAGLLRHRLPPALQGRVAVSSAGTHSLHGHQAEPLAVQTMAKIGIDIRDHRARHITREMVRQADLILTMEQNQLETVHQLLGWNKFSAQLLMNFNPLADGPEVEDPYGRKLSAYQACLQTLEPCIEGVIAHLQARLLVEAADSSG